MDLFRYIFVWIENVDSTQAIQYAVTVRNLNNKALVRKNCVSGFVKQTEEIRSGRFLRIYTVAFLLTQPPAVPIF